MSLSGEGTDPAGDGGVADLVFASFEVIGSNMRVRAEATAGTFHPDSLLMTFNLDTDESALTGYTTINPGHVGMGIDCFVELGKYTTQIRGARVRRWVNGTAIPTWTGEVTVLVNGYEATMPLSACQDDGRAVFRADAFRQVGDIGTTVRQDWLPDPPGAPIAVR